MESNPQLELAHEFVEFTGVNVFLTGKAGSGKTTFLRSIHSRSSKRVVVAAPTGVAALNAGGVTLHSLFQLPFSPFIPNKSENEASSAIQIKKFSRQKLALIRSIELLIIDEISMVRSDMLDAVDETLRQIRRSSKPFGGVQLLMIGDVNQLSPILKDSEKDMLSGYYQSQYFFDSLALKNCNYITIELEKIYRQRDAGFTKILNDIRDRKISYETLAKLNERCISNVEDSQSDEYIRLTTHNSVANRVNEDKLRALDSKSKYFTSSIKGDFPESIYPNDNTLEFKKGAKVIFIKNDSSQEKLYYNGMRGEIIDFSDSHITVKPNDKDENIDVYPETWDNIEYKLNSETSEIEETVKGSFSQFPLKCAWAITIHKSQGLTFDKAIIDTGSAFAYGQVYVALSRIRSLEGVILSSPIKLSSIIGSSQVDSFNAYIKENVPNSEVLDICKKTYFESLLLEIFDFTTFKGLAYSLLRIVTTNLHKSYPALVAEYTDSMKLFETEVFNVGKSFQGQIRHIISTEDYTKSIFLKERVQKAGAYFEEKLEKLLLVLDDLKSVDIDAKETKKRFKELLISFNSELKIKELAVKLCAECFDIREYQKIKAKVASESLGFDSQFKTKSDKLPKEVIHKDLYYDLKEWRKYASQETGIRVSSILPTKSLMQIQATLPRTLKELKKISGIGARILDNYSEDILEIVQEFCVSNDIDPERDGFSVLQFDEQDGEADLLEKAAKSTKKTPTHLVTLDMIHEKLSLDAIAKKRELTIFTIESHVVKLVTLGMLDLLDYVDEKSYERIKLVLEQNEGKKLSEIKEILGVDTTYFEINLVKAALKK